MPQDVQAEAYDYPEALLRERVWTVYRQRGDATALERAARWIRDSRAPLIVAGGGVLYSEACGSLADFAASTGIPVAETQAGKGALRFDHPQALGGDGCDRDARGECPRGGRLTSVIGIGTRYSDFTSASKTAFQKPGRALRQHQRRGIRRVQSNAALPVVADAKAALDELSILVSQWRVPTAYENRIRKYRDFWEREVDRIYGLGHGPPISQGEVIGAVNKAAR